MHEDHGRQIAFVLLLAVTCLVWAGSWTVQPAWAQDAGHQPSAQPVQAATMPPGHHQGEMAPSSGARVAPHGGQVTKTALYCVEVVYRPQEIRVYLYEASLRPLTARGLQGRATMKVQGQKQLFVRTLGHVVPPAGSREQDYLAAQVNLSRVRDGSMAVTFELSGLPHPQEPQAIFTQQFALSKVPLQVTLASLTKADQPGIARQKVCPVTGTELGAHGAPVKVLIGDQTEGGARPVYLCCKGCLTKVQKDPGLYLQTVYPPAEATSGDRPLDGARLTVTAATAADRAAIQAQRVCPVTGAPLGSMGTPLKVTIGGQDVFLCCRGCLGKVRANPERYFRTSAE
jgi:YHS domain-containing protein